MSKVLKIAATAETGRDIKECAVAWGVLCDKSAIMEGLPSSRTDTHTTHGAAPVLNLEVEFARIDAQAEEQQRLKAERQALLRHQEKFE
jgi:hypothetical protein